MRKKADTIVSLEKVSLTLPGPSKKPVHILHDITLQVQQGETISIVGPSGSGKTSLLMLIAGVEKATKGKLQIAGQDITNFGEDELAAFRRDHVGIVFQNFHLIPTMTALENVSVALEFTGNENAPALAKKHLKAVERERIIILNPTGNRLSFYRKDLPGHGERVMIWELSNTGGKAQ